MQLRPADDCGVYAAFAYARLVADDESGAVCQVVNCEAEGVYLLCGEIVAKLSGLVAKFASNIVINFAVFIFQRLHGVGYGCGHVLGNERSHGGKVACLFVWGLKFGRLRLRRRSLLCRRLFYCHQSTICLAHSPRLFAAP